MAATHPQLAQLGISHFKQRFKAPLAPSLLEIINLVGHFLRYLDLDGIDDLIKPISIGELESTLKWFKRDKSPCPDGWSMEFYIAFVDIIGPDLLGVIEESRTLGRIYAPLNSTYIALIPKTDSPSSFHELRPISLCNCLYKIIAKIIANRIKPILSEHISQEQFAFLHNRHIHKAISSAQEALHSIKLKKLKGMALKIDLSKAFDKVSWLYLRMILTHLGFPLEFIRWIMGWLYYICILCNSYKWVSLPRLSGEKGYDAGMPLIPPIVPPCYGRPE